MSPNSFNIATTTTTTTRSEHDGPHCTREDGERRGEAHAARRGNPRIAKADGDAPVQAWIAGLPDWKRGVGRQVDALVVQAAPDVLKAVKWNSPFYGREGNGWFLSMHAYTKYVKVAFFRGASLRPMPPGESARPDVRYLDVHAFDAIDEAQFVAWVRQAAALPGWRP